MTDSIIPMDASVVRHSEIIRETRFAADDEAAGAAVVAMAVISSYTNSAASNGNNIVAKAEIDPAYESDFVACMGEATYILRIEGQDYGELLVVKVDNWVDVEAHKHSRVVLKWPHNQVAESEPLGRLVSKTKAVRLELWEVQIPIFGAKVE